MTKTRGSLSIFSPLPPTRSGIADYCREQLERLSQLWDITLVCEETPDAQAIPDSAKVVAPRDFIAETGTTRLYHLGNNIHHEFVFWELQLHPGVLVLHDYVQHHLITELTLARGRESEYASLLEMDLGDVGREAADQRIAGTWNEAFNFLIPANSCAVNAATAVVVHSEWARCQLTARFPGKPIMRIPHHFARATSSPGVVDRASARQRLGIPESELHIVSLGFITRPKQIELALSALGRCRPDMPRFRYSLVGDPQDDRSLRNHIDLVGLEQVAEIIGYVDLATLQDYILSADIVINLRYPSAGETSGTLIRTLGEGRCAVVFDYSSFTDFPADTVARIPLDTTTTLHLERTLTHLARDPDYRHSLERNARRFIAEHHDLGRCIAAYDRFLGEHSYSRQQAVLG